MLSSAQMRPKTPASAAPPGPGLADDVRPEMQGLMGIAGQDRVVATLRSAIQGGRPHHAYLFDGPEGVGKATCARALFAALNCAAPPAPGDACGRCAACQKLLHGTHPDLIPFDMTLAGLADEAERLIRRLGYPPHEGRAQLVVFDPADNFAMPTAATAANRLLKTLEEPVPGTYFVLVSTAAQGLMQTLRSRTQRLRFLPLSDEVLLSELTRRHGVPEEVARGVIKPAQGSLGRALRQVQEGERLVQRQDAARGLREAAESGRAQRMVEAAAAVGQDREEAQQVLSLLWLQLHEELRGQVTRAPGGGLDRLLRQLRAILDATEAIRRFTSAPLALERMLRALSSTGLDPAGRAA